MVDIDNEISEKKIWKKLDMPREPSLLELNQIKGTNSMNAINLTQDTDDNLPFIYILDNSEDENEQNTGNNLNLANGEGKKCRKIVGISEFTNQEMLIHNNKNDEDIESSGTNSNSLVLGKAAIKKSCIDPSQQHLPNMRAVKKSCIAEHEKDFEEIQYNRSNFKIKPLSEKRNIFERPSKYKKIERDNKTLRIKRAEDTIDKLSTLITMRENFLTKKSSEITTLDDSAHTLNPNSTSNTYKFLPSLQKCTEIFESGSLFFLEQKLKEYLRKNATPKLNSYQLPDTPETLEAFGFTEISYNFFSNFVKNHSIAIE